MAVIDPIHTNEKGGKQSLVRERYDLIPGSSLRVLAGVYGDGATKYAANNWRLIPLHDHINHALNHLAAYFELGEYAPSVIRDPLNQIPRPEDHLAHALCRLSMAVAIRETGEFEPGDFRIGEPPKRGWHAATHRTGHLRDVCTLAERATTGGMQA